MLPCIEKRIFLNSASSTFFPPFVIVRLVLFCIEPIVPLKEEKVYSEIIIIFL
jgi:hypothetical protein